MIDAALRAALNAQAEAERLNRAALPELLQRRATDPYFHAVVTVIQRAIRKGDTDPAAALLVARDIERILEQR